MNNEKWITSGDCKYRVLHIITDPATTKRAAKRLDKIIRQKKKGQNYFLEVGKFYVGLMPDDFDPLADVDVFLVIRHATIFMCDLNSKTTVSKPAGFAR